jgi:hypothetical protein
VRLALIRRLVDMLEGYGNDLATVVSPWRRD